MGIIIKESFNQTAIRIAISVIGAIATIFIYPMDRELYGILGNVINTSVLLMPFVVIGLGQASIRFFPFSSSSLKSRKAFLFFLAKILFFNCILFSVLFFVLKDPILAMAKNPSSDYEKYFIYAFPGAILFALVGFLVSYISNYKVVAIPVGLQSSYRLVIPVSFLLIFFGMTSIDQGIIYIFAALFIALFILLFLIYRNIGSLPDNDKKENVEVDRKQFFKFYFWSFASSLGAMLAFKIDAFMIPWLTDFTLGGDYMIALVVIGAIVIPISSVVSIAHPIIAQAWKDNNINEIKAVYLKSSRNLLWIGTAMLLGILLLLDLLPIFLDRWKDLVHLKLIVLILGMGKLFDMASGINGVIIAHSKWFRFNTYFVLILVVSNILLNYFLIVTLELGILGAAIATAISVVLVNLLKLVLIQVKLKTNPFDGKTIGFVLMLSCVICANFYLSQLLNEVLAVVVSAFLGMMFLAFTLYPYNFAEETRRTFYNIWKKLYPGT